MTFSTERLMKFADLMYSCAQNVSDIRAITPRFEGWNLVPGAGLPLIGLLYYNRFNSISDTWADCARILQTVLETDSKKVADAAVNYRSAEALSKAAIDKINR
ncbi:hypothetical protein [Nonomuraea dietziae]|uniref:hypothetical protein n=1 Tax=Nonomuraea dietziae TaxID=65515 RepID=UPI0033DDBF78